MTANKRTIPPWLWACAILGAGALAVLLVFSDRSPEPPPAYRFDVSHFQKTDAEQVLFAEATAIALSLNHPTCLALGNQNDIYVGAENAVVCLDAKGTETKRHSLSVPPRAMAVVNSETLLIAFEKHCALLNLANGSLSEWPTFDEKSTLTSVVVLNGEAYAADAGKRCIYRCDMQGAVLQIIGARDEARNVPGLIVPSPYLDLAIDPLDALWTVNPGRHGLEQYRSNGDLVTSWYRAAMTPDGFCGCCNPIHTAFRKDGSLVTAEKGLFRVKLYSADQQYLGLVAGPEAFGQTADAAMSPDVEPPIKDMAIDAENRILVLDGAQNAIRVFVQKESFS